MTWKIETSILRLWEEPPTLAAFRCVGFSFSSSPPLRLGILGTGLPFVVALCAARFVPLHLLAGTSPEKLPLILFPDGTRLPEPPLPAVADKIGLRMHAQTNFYDLAIVGGGPAGLAAAVYGASEGLRIWAKNLLCCALNQSISGVTKTKKAIRIAPQRSSCHSALPPSSSAQTNLKPPSNHLGV